MNYEIMLNFDWYKKVELNGEIHLYGDRGIFTLCSRDKRYIYPVKDNPPVTCETCREKLLKAAIEAVNERVDEFLGEPVHA